MLTGIGIISKLFGWLAPPKIDCTEYARKLISEGAKEGVKEHDVAEFIRQTANSGLIIDIVDRTAAIRSLINVGSEEALRYRLKIHSGNLAIQHENDGRFMLSMIESAVLYLHGDDSGFRHLAHRMEESSFASADPDDYKHTLNTLTRSTSKQAVLDQLKEEFANAPSVFVRETKILIEQNPQILQVLRSDLLFYRARVCALAGQEKAAHELCAQAYQNRPTDLIHQTGHAFIEPILVAYPSK